MNCQLFKSVSLQPFFFFFLQIEYVQDTFNLQTPYQAFQFFFELHNLPSAFPLGSKAQNASSRFTTLIVQVRNANLDSYSKEMKTDGPKTQGTNQGTETQEPNAAPPGGSSLSLYDDVSTVRKLSAAGYKLFGASEISGCYPVFPAGSFL